jgi:hypothetical protein
MKAFHAKTTVNNNLQRFILWSTVVLYTACLPYAIFVYRSIVSQFSPRIAGRVSLFIIIALAAIYTVICIKKKLTVRCLIVLAVSGIIVTFVMNFETNANKHIHIPEYILMSWILYRALALDYHGSGILLLVFICGAMLGVVDEIMQGIHPQRTYGWTDMIVDAAAGLIGCLSLMGLKQPIKGDWAWYGDLKHFRGYSGGHFLWSINCRHHVQLFVQRPGDGQLFQWLSLVAVGRQWSLCGGVFGADRVSLAPEAKLQHVGAGN